MIGPAVAAQPTRAAAVAGSAPASASGTAAEFDQALQAELGDTSITTPDQEAASSAAGTATGAAPDGTSAGAVPPSPVRPDSEELPGTPGDWSAALGSLLAVAPAPSTELADTGATADGGSASDGPASDGAVSDGGVAVSGSSIRIDVDADAALAAAVPAGSTPTGAFVSGTPIGPDGAAATTAASTPVPPTREALAMSTSIPLAQPSVGAPPASAPLSAAVRAGSAADAAAAAVGLPQAASASERGTTIPASVGVTAQPMSAQSTSAAAVAAGSLPSLGEIGQPAGTAQAAPVVAPVVAPVPPTAVLRDAAPAQVAPRPVDPPLTPQLLRPLAALAQAGPGQHTLSIDVAPEAIGPVTVRAHVGSDGLRIELFAPSDAGREAIRAIIGDLRRDLATTGLGASLDLSNRDQPDASQQQERGRDEPGTAAERPAPVAERPAPSAARVTAATPALHTTIDVMA
ncbi:MAG: flagellar hook-length control protein FliK [Leifsonia sp.]